MILKKNPRNAVFVGENIVIKYRRDWNLRKIFNEFLLSWKASLHGLTPTPVLIGPIIVRRTAKGIPLAKVETKKVWRDLIELGAALSRAGIDHKEVRHPGYHVIVGDKLQIIDLERGKLTRRPKNLSRIVPWLLAQRINPDKIKEAVEAAEAPENDKKGALEAIKRWKPVEGRRQRAPRDHQAKADSSVRSSGSA